MLCEVISKTRGWLKTAFPPGYAIWDGKQFEDNDHYYVPYNANASDSHILTIDMTYAEYWKLLHNRE